MTKDTALAAALRAAWEASDTQFAHPADEEARIDTAIAAGDTKDMLSMLNFICKNQTPGGNGALLPPQPDIAATRARLLHETAQKPLRGFWQYDAFGDGEVFSGEVLEFRRTDIPARLYIHHSVTRSEAVCLVAELMVAVAGPADWTGFEGTQDIAPAGDALAEASAYAAGLSQSQHSSVTDLPF